MNIIRFILSIFCCSFITYSSISAAQATDNLYPVGVKQLEFVSKDGRNLAFALFYPAVIAKSAKPVSLPFFTNLHFYDNAKPLTDHVKRPLIIFSHGYGSNGVYYAWFAEFLAARGYIVAAVYHYRANTYDSNAMYLASKLWQRPLDVSADINFLLKSKEWGPLIDPDRIGVAGHSQGGFTSLWVGGAKVNPKQFLFFQNIWKNNWMVPAYIRKPLPLDAKPALHVKDARVKAAFAMAPGDIKVFGMDEPGLKQLSIPTYIIVGERDTQTPPKDNAEFAAKYIPNVQLEIIPGHVDHEIFVNECNQIGKDSFPEACIDAPGIDRTKLHESIGNSALKFFNENLKEKK